MIRSILFAAALTIAAAPALADDNATVKHRKDVMAVIGGGMGTFGCVMKGQCDLPGKVLKNVARGMHLAGTMAPAAFKMETPGATMKTTASAKIWQNWDKFNGGLMMMNENLAKLVEVAASGDKGQIGPIMGALGKSCKGCHEAFREK